MTCPGLPASGESRVLRSDANSLPGGLALPAGEVGQLGIVSSDAGDCRVGAGDCARPRCGPARALIQGTTASRPIGRRRRACDRRRWPADDGRGTSRNSRKCKPERSERYPAKRIAALSSANSTRKARLSGKRSSEVRSEKTRQKDEGDGEGCRAIEPARGLLLIGDVEQIVAQIVAALQLAEQAQKVGGGTHSQAQALCRLL